MGACAVKIHLHMSHEASCERIERENAADQDRGPPFVLACPVQMHLHMLKGRVPRTKAGGPHFVRGCAVEMRLHVPKHCFCPNILRQNAANRLGDHTLCEVVKLKCTCTCPSGPSAVFVRKFGSKMPPTSWSALIKYRPLYLA